MTIPAPKRPSREGREPLFRWLTTDVLLKNNNWFIFYGNVCIQWTAWSCWVYRFLLKLSNAWFWYSIIEFIIARCLDFVWKVRSIWVPVWNLCGSNSHPRRIEGVDRFNFARPKQNITNSGAGPGRNRNRLVTPLHISNNSFANNPSINCFRGLLISLWSVHIRILDYISRYYRSRMFLSSRYTLKDYLTTFDM